MDRHLSFSVTEEESGRKIEEFLKQNGCSHHVLTHLKRTDHGIILNGEWAYSSTRLQCGDVLELWIREEEASDQIIPTPLPLNIVYEDEDLMVINKPPDMPIHPSINNHEKTLANAVMYYFREKGEAFVYRCVNRLDRDTSGLLILAKNMFSAAVLYRQSAERKIHREYLAIAAGEIPEEGIIDAPIARAADSAIMRCVDFSCGERAVTHYRRLLYSKENDCSLQRIRLETGRTHQIRVHMKYIGHPLLGDFLYHPTAIEQMKRQALHSWSLAFTHPVTGKQMHFTALPPSDMQEILNDMGQKNLLAES